MMTSLKVSTFPHRIRSEVGKGPDLSEPGQNLRLTSSAGVVQSRFAPGKFQHLISWEELDFFSI